MRKWLVPRLPHLERFWNPQAWALIVPFSEVPSFDAMCSLAVRCQSGHPHQIASVVSDDHGRYAMNIIYENQLDYLKDLKEWEETRDKDIEPYIKEVEENFSETGSSNDDTIMKATDSYAVYIRFKRNLSCYYG